MIRAFLIFFFFALICDVSRAGSTTPRAVYGKVAVDGAAVYSKPDFDSEVIDSLNQGVKIPASTKQYSGQGGMGLFHRIKTPRGRVGYLPDTDVILPKGTHVETPKGAAPRKKPLTAKEKEKTTHVEKNEEYDRKSIYQTRYIGGSVAMVDYTEKFSGNKLDSQTPFFGLRMTGPDILFKSPPLDFNVQVSPFAPKYLSSFAQGSGSGFLLMTDLTLNMPLYDTTNSLLYYGVGLLLTFSDYKVSVGSGSYNSMDLRIGADVELGYAYRFGHYVVRGDLKYYIEKTYYLSELVSFQVEY